MDRYPLQFNLSSNMKTQQFGNLASRYSYFRTAESSALASLYDGDEGVELRIGNVRFGLSGSKETRYFIQSKKHPEDKIVWLPSNTIFYSPEQVKVALYRQMREWNILTRHFNHVLECVEIFYPHLEESLKNSLDDIGRYILYVNLGLNEYSYEVKTNFEKGTFYFLIHASDKKFSDKSEFQNFLSRVETCRNELALTFSNMALSARKMKGLTQTGFSWSINEDYYQHALCGNKNFGSFFGKELMQLTSDGITLSIQLDQFCTEDEIKYDVIVIENNNDNPIFMTTIYGSTCISEHFHLLKSKLSELFFHDMTGLTHISKRAIEKPMSLIEWKVSKNEEMERMLGDDFEFETYATKEFISDNRVRYIFMFISASDTLKDLTKYEAIYERLEMLVEN